MNVMREADTLPELPTVAVSDATTRTFSTGTPTASAAIWANTVCAPCPTSAPAWYSITSSISAPPRSSMMALAVSGAPKLKPTFLKPAPKPMPRRLTPFSGCGGFSRRRFSPS